MKCEYLELVDYSNLSSRYSLVKLHCKKCNEIWAATYEKGLETKESPFCENRKNI